MFQVEDGVEVAAQQHSSMRCSSHFSRQTRYTSASRRARQLAGARAALALVTGRWKMGGIPCLPACPALRLIARSLLVACCCSCRRRLSRAACRSALLSKPTRPRPSSRGVGVPVLHSEPVAFTAAAESV
jgi:hypothetical protein